MSGPHGVCVLLILCLVPAVAAAADYRVEAPAIVHAGEAFPVTLAPVRTLPIHAPEAGRLRVAQTPWTDLSLTGAPLTIENVKIDEAGTATLELDRGDANVAATQVRVIPGWTSLLPPLVAIGLALWLRTVIPAIFAGLWIGVIVREGFSVTHLFTGLLDAFQVDVLNAVTNRDHVAILLFSCMIGGMVGIISHNGGMQGVVNRVVRWASNPRRGQLSVWFLGILVFFDDYTNTLVVGNAVRPVTDRLKISREKLAYIVDSTAAPVACLAFITTWIGYEVGLIAQAIERLDGIDQAPYEIFLHSIPYSFYPLLAVFFVFLIAITRRDFGPMLAAERRSYATGQVAPHHGGTVAPGAQTGADLPEDMPTRAVNAVIPILVLVAGCVIGLYVSGSGETLRDRLSTADAYQALMWGSLLSVLAAAALTLGQRLLPLHRLVEAWSDGVTVMVAPLMILILAWALSDVTEALGTADYLVRVGGESLNPAWVPAWAFVLAAVAAFATGTSWGVMAILLPLLVPLVWATLGHTGLANPDHYYLLHSTVACVLSGAVWGDHCSPISDTTVLSSMASGCDHIEHVRTQMPYALTVGAAALLFGTIPTGFGMPWWIGLPLGGAMLYVLLRGWGRHAILEV